MHNEKSFFEYFDEIKELKKSLRIAVAVSGGIDSLALTLLADKWARKNNIKIIGITIDHQLRPSSKDEAENVGKILKKNSIEHVILTWEGEKPKTNIENIARETRYNLLFDYCKKNEINAILLGHHLQDQAENFLIRLFRGSGIAGLSSMEKVTKRNDFILIRPFLDVKKDDLQNYLIQNKIEWVEDESNSDEKYLRNKIRNFLNSFEDKENIIKRINSTIETFHLAESIIKNELDKLKNDVYFFDSEYKYYTFGFEKFFKLDKELQLRLLSKISKNVSSNVNNPRLAKLERLLEVLHDLKKYTFYGCVFEKINNDNFVCYREYNSIKDKENYIKKGELNKYLKQLKEKDPVKYKKIKDFRGYKREILYTILKVK